MEIKNKKETIEFLKKHPHPKKKIVPHFEDGYFSCITPIPTICGAELLANEKTMSLLSDLREEIKEEESSNGK